MTRPFPIAACLALACVLAPSALAQTPAPATQPAATVPGALQGDAARGKALTYTCQGCHGVTGYKNAYPNYHVPRIGDQSSMRQSSSFGTAIAWSRRAASSKARLPV